MQVFHGCGAENNEKPHPEGRALEGNGFIGLSLIGLIVRLENDRVEEQREEAQHEKKFDHEDHEILGVVLHPAAGLRDQNLIDVMEVHTAGKQQDDQ